MDGQRLHHHHHQAPPWLQAAAAAAVACNLNAPLPVYSVQSGCPAGGQPASQAAHSSSVSPSFYNFAAMNLSAAGQSNGPPGPVNRPRARRGEQIFKLILKNQIAFQMSTAVDQLFDMLYLIDELIN